jgi:hypothetical protein
MENKKRNYLLRFTQRFATIQSLRLLEATAYGSGPVQDGGAKRLGQSDYLR